jgi:hypothetical protein
MGAPIATAGAILPLWDRAEVEDLDRRHPWEEPPSYPDGVHTIVTLDLQGQLRRQPEEVCDWTDVVAYRFESSFGFRIDPDGDFEWGY